MRKIYLHGEINEAMFTKFSKKLDKLIATASGPNDTIDIELYSEGGQPYPALAIYSKLRACPLPIRLQAFGAIMSAASIILAGADIREASTDAWFMVHETTETEKGNLTSHRIKAIQMQKEELQWADILARHSAWPIETWRKASHKTTYLTAFQLKQIKLIHNIIPSKGNS